MEPISYWPVEILLNLLIVYIAIYSKNIYERVALMIALILHITRQWRYRKHIKDVSDKKTNLFLISIFFVTFYGLYLNNVSKWPIPVYISIILGILYHKLICMFIKDSGKQFTLFDPSIDIPQIIVSGIFSTLAIQSKNNISILWLSDLVYHILEILNI